MTVVKLVIFAAASSVLFVFSLPSLRRRNDHGFFRFFAFELMVLLLLLNVGPWFRDPFSPRQIVSWMFLAASIFLVIHGFYMLAAVGKPQGEFENTTVLVARGAYRFIRHPLYASIFYFAWGAFLKKPSLLAATLALACSVFLYATARVEERENIGRFGRDYAAYMAKTKMFVPFLF